jgi:hypothetical protein
MKEENKQKAVIFDIDGVLAKISKNEDGTPKRGYRDYDKVDLDEPIKEVCETILTQCLLEIGATIIFVTGRKEKCFEGTLEWLECHMKYKNYMGEYKTYYFGKRNGFKVGQEFYVLDSDFGIPKCKGVIFMRPDNDHRPAEALKKEIYETKIKYKYDVIMAFDDDPKVCEMYKKEGILTMQVKSRLPK